MWGQDPGSALSRSRAAVSCTSQFCAGRLFLSVASMLKPPILRPSLSSGPRKLLPDKMREGGKVREEAGPTPGVLGTRDYRCAFFSGLCGSNVTSSSPC